MVRLSISAGASQKNGCSTAPTRIGRAVSEEVAPDVKKSDKPGKQAGGSIPPMMFRWPDEMAALIPAAELDHFAQRFFQNTPIVENTPKEGGDVRVDAFLVAQLFAAAPAEAKDRVFYYLNTVLCGGRAEEPQPPRIVTADEILPPSPPIAQTAVAAPGDDTPKRGRKRRDNPYRQTEGVRSLTCVEDVLICYLRTGRWLTPFDDARAYRQDGLRPDAGMTPISLSRENRQYLKTQEVLFRKLKHLMKGRGMGR
jgi:hypothetical protein